MNLRLRDVSDLIYADFSQYYVDPYNYKIYWELYVELLPYEIKERLIPIPSIYKDKLIEITVSFINVSTNRYPELIDFQKEFKGNDLKFRVLSYVDCCQIWDEWKQHAKKYLVNQLKKWCIENKISYSM